MRLKRVLIILFLCIAVSQGYAQKENKGKAVIKTTIACDHCKACETCGKNFQANMLKIKGVKMFELDEKAMTITVYYNPKKTDLETIRMAISKFGYDADEVKADPEAYRKLDDCCKMS